MNRQHPSLNQAMPIVAAALGRRFGVSVQVGGNAACTDGQTIQIPALADDADLLPVAWGYLAHEAGHVRYTDFDAYREAAATADPLQVSLQNILEDIRIEQALARPYPGTRETLQAVCSRLLADGGLRAPKPDHHPARVLSSYLLLSLRHEVLSYEVLADEAKKARQVLEQVFPGSLVRRLRAMLADVRHLASTAEAVALARRIRGLLEDTSTASASNAETAASASGEQRTDSSGQTADSLPPTPQESAPSDESDAKQRTELQCEDGRMDASSASPNAPALGDASAAPAPADETTAGQVKAVVQALSASAGDLPGDLFADARALLARAATDTGHCLFPRPEPYAGNPRAGLELLARVQPESRRLMARLQGLVQASRFDRPAPVRRGSRLMPKRLYRAALGDARLFARKRERVTVNTALHLLIDLSSSMGAPVRVAGDRTRARDTIALESALALALALDAIHGVSLAVSAFPGRSGDQSRLSTLIRHGERARARSGAFVQRARGGTPMRGALMFAAADLLARPEPRRVILVLTDGQPAELDATRELLRHCAQAGLETLGIGIGIDVSGLFATAIQVQDIAELKTQLFGAAERLLLAA